MEFLRKSLPLFALAITLNLAAGCGNGCGGLNPRLIHAKILKVNNISQVNGHPPAVVRDSAGISDADRAEAIRVRNIAQSFYADVEKDLDLNGDPEGSFTIRLWAVSHRSTTSTYPTVTDMTIVTNSNHQEGEETHNGYAELRFGGGDELFTTQGADTLFDLEVSDVYREGGAWKATGTFSAIARNAEDPSDSTRFLVMDGAFTHRIRNQ
jgi:hypothetical protein